MLGSISRLNSISHRFVQKYGREPTDEELSVEMGVSTKKLEQIIKATWQPVSLDNSLGQEGDTHLGDFIEDEGSPRPSEVTESDMLKEQLSNSLVKLSIKERCVIELRFGLNDDCNRTLDEVGQAFGLTRERIRQIQNKALSKLRQPKKSRVLRGYID
jgi:RNA polymerase primary sigma factor